MKNNDLAIEAEVTGLGKSPYLAYLLLAVTALLVFMEFRYNVALLNSISDPSTTPVEASDLSNKGKLLAAFGLTWAIFKGFLLKARNFLVALLVLGLMTFAGYWGLDTLYDKVIDNLKPEVKVMGFNLLSYRHDLLTGELEDSDIPNLKDSPVTGKIFMGAFPIVLLDDRFMVPAQDLVTRKADEKQASTIELSEEKWADYSSNMTMMRKAYDRYIESSLKAAGGNALDSDWQKYSAEMAKINTSHERFVETAKRASGEADLDREWASYSDNMNSLRASHREFIDGSYKAARYGSRGTDAFRRQSGGLDPNTGLALSQFPALVKRSSHPKANQIRQSETRVIGHQFDGKPIYAGEMPYFMNRQDFYGWIAQKAKEGLALAGLPVKPTLSKSDFLELIRQSKTANGEELRKYEQREIGQSPDGRKVLAGDMPYFMNRQDFYDWSGKLVRDSMAAVGLSPNEKASIKDFVEILRSSTGDDGKRLREAESKLVTKRPDGSVILVRDVPYFMSKATYQQWVLTEAEKFKAMAMPTIENVNSVKNIKQVNAAIFIPPMAIISSLTSALVNAISLVLFVLATVLTLSGVGTPLGLLIKKHTVVLMLLVFAGLVTVMPPHVFDKGTPLHDLETKLHQEVGVAAALWSRLSNVQKYFL